MTFFRFSVKTILERGDIMDTPLKAFSENLKLFRKGRGLSQAALADKAGLAKQSIINYEKGITFPTGRRLQNLVEALNVTTDQLMGDLFKPEEETDLLTAYNEKAAFEVWYANLPAEEQRTALLDYLSRKGKNELYNITLESFDKKIKQASRKYEKMVYNANYSKGGGFNGDVYLDLKHYGIEE